MIQIIAVIEKVALCHRAGTGSTNKGEGLHRYELENMMLFGHSNQFARNAQSRCLQLLFVNFP